MISRKSEKKESKKKKINFKFWISKDVEQKEIEIEIQSSREIKDDPLQDKTSVQEDLSWSITENSQVINERLKSSIDNNENDVDHCEKANLIYKNLINIVSVSMEVSTQSPSEDSLQSLLDLHNQQLKLAEQASQLISEDRALGDISNLIVDKTEFEERVNEYLGNKKETISILKI